MAGIRVIPVIDLKAGQVVRGIAGRRAEYKPVVSQLTRSSEPVEVARAFRDQLALNELYVADLDAIAGAEPAWHVYAGLKHLGFKLWIDAGVRDLERSRRLQTAGVDNVIIALETLGGPKQLERFWNQLGSEQMVLSLDLHGGEPMGDRAAWNHANAWEIATAATRLGVCRLIVLEVAYVGTGQGPAAHVLSLCQRLWGVAGAESSKPRHPQRLEIVAGGGVRGVKDLQLLEDHGVSAALVASALHDGRISEAHFKSIVQVFPRHS